MNRELESSRLVAGLTKTEPTETNTRATPDALRDRWRAYTGFIAWPTVALMTALVAGEALVWAGVLGGSLAIGWAMLAATVLAYAGFTVMHEASHGNIDGGEAAAAWLEEALGWIGGFLLFAPYPVFRAMHLQHHAHTNDPERDPDHWVAADTPMSVLARCFTIFPHYYAEFFRGRFGGPGVGVRSRAGSIVGVSVMIALLVGLVAAGLGREALLLWVVPAWLASAVLAFAFDWLPHHPHAIQERFRNTRVLLGPGLTLSLLWQNYHLIHHLYPRVPFYLYGRCFDEVRPLLEAEGAPIEGFGAGALTAPFLSHPAAPRQALDRGRFGVVVSRCERPNPSAITLHFRREDGEPLVHTAGQYMTFQLTVEGEELSRCYSLCTAPDASGEHAITVKRVDGGRASNWFNDNGRVGMVLVAKGPSGRFMFAPQTPTPELVLIGGGSGVTPLISMAITAMRDTESTRVTVILGNRDTEHILFREALDELEREHPLRLTVLHVLDNPPPDWDGGAGRLDEDNLATQLTRVGPSDGAGVLYRVCGPTPMMDAARRTLLARGVDPERIAEERFVAAPAKAKRADLPAQQVTFRIGGQEREIRVEAGQTLVEAAIANDVPVLWSCGAGNCGTCIMRLDSGEVDQPDAIALLAQEREDGWVLGCCARPRTACVVTQR
ncbi:MAG: ferredoxin-NADP reductase/fatty acid desaturase [Bradymonadia bacterium]